MRQDHALNDPLKSAALAALSSIVEPLVELMFDTGVTVQEFTKILRERAVRRATARLSHESGQSSKSRVAILTGLPRSEVARLLKSPDASMVGRVGQNPARRVIGGWYDNPIFLSDTGDPLILPIYGAKRSFERLVARYSGGIPVRAMLDELIQINAIEVLPGQKVRVKSRVPTFTGLTSAAVAALGDRARDLLDTLRTNLRASTPLFEGTAIMTDVEVEAIPVIRRELAEQAAVFIEGANSLLSRSRSRLRQSTSKNLAKSRIGITAFYFETEPGGNSGEGAPTPHGKRKNLRRRLGKTPKRVTASRSGGRHT